MDEKMKDLGKFDNTMGFLKRGQDVRAYKLFFEMTNSRIKARMEQIKDNKEIYVKLYHLTEFIIDIIEKLDYETMLDFNNLHKLFEVLRTCQDEEKRKDMMILIENALNDQINYYRIMYGYVTEKNTIEERFNQERIKIRNIFDEILQTRTKLEGLIEEYGQRIPSIEILLNNTYLLEELYKFIYNKASSMLKPTPQDYYELKEVNNFVLNEKNEIELHINNIHTYDTWGESFLQRIRLEQCIKYTKEDKPTM